MSSDRRLALALRLFDDANGDDPRIENIDGRTFPAEVLYARRMSARLQDLHPDAAPELRLAVHGSHLCRWRIPRARFPRDRAGYLSWRAELAIVHADMAGRLMACAGYEDQAVARVQRLIRKERLGADPEASALEDVACLVFLEHTYPEFCAGQPDDKMIRILQRTWRKMSADGRGAARRLSLAGRPAALLKKVIDPGNQD